MGTRPGAAKPSAAPLAGFRVFNRIDWITSERMQLLNITDRINEIVQKSGIRDSLVHLQSLHATRKFERRNADSRLRGLLMGQTLSLQVRNAAVLLGTWQSILLAEFDGPRSRSLAVQVSGI